MGYVTMTGMHSWLGATAIDFNEPSFDLIPNWYGGQFGRAFVHGDFNADGYDDAIGADYGEKKFSLWLGKQNVNGTSDYIYCRPGSTNFGYALASGDFDADGYCDIAISAPFENDAPPQGTFYGFVWVHAGNSLLADTTVANDDPALPPASGQIQVRISPNPVSRAGGLISVDVSGAFQGGEQGVMDIFNIRGERISRSALTAHRSGATITIPLTGLANGIYIGKINIEGTIKLVKFSISK